MLAAYSKLQTCGASNRTYSRPVSVTCGRPAYPATCQAARGSLVCCLVQPLSLRSTAQLQGAPSSRPGSSKGSVACSARLARHKNSATDADVPTTLADALQQAARFAAPGSSCPPDVLAKLEEMDAALGGRFYLITCGAFDESHPLAGKPARALLQLVLVSMLPDLSGASLYRLRDKPQQIQVMHNPQDMVNPMIYMITYQLGEDGWPNGVAYNSATNFEKATNKKGNKKVMNSAWLTYDGVEVMSLHVFFKHHLQPLDVAVVPRELTPLLQRYFHDQLEAAGVEVMRQEDAVMRTMRLKQQRQQLAKEKLGGGSSWRSRRRGSWARHHWLRGRPPTGCAAQGKHSKDHES